MRSANHKTLKLFFKGLGEVACSNRVAGVGVNSQRVVLFRGNLPDVPNRRRA